MPQASTDPQFLRDAALSLLETDTSPWMTLYMPVDRARNRIQLRNLLDELREEATQAGISQSDVDAMLAPADDLLDDASSVDEAAKGRALFSSPNAEEPVSFDLPFAPPLVARADARPSIRPLWRGLEPDGQYYVLSLWGGGMRLHRGSRYHLEVVSPDEEPESLDAVLQADPHVQAELNRPKQSPNEPSSQAPAIYQSQQDIRQKPFVKEGLLRYFRDIDDRIRARLEPESGPTPLILAGPKKLRRLYRQANNYKSLLDEGIENQVRRQGPAPLHRRAWELVRDRFDQPRRDALDQFQAAPDRTAATPESVLLATLEGRVDTLFVAEAPVVWGSFDTATHSVRINPDRQAGDVDVLNAATVATLQSGGTAYVTDADSVPGDAPISALLRY